ncbi:MAG: hypothetical protein JO156_13830 [Solirubrobacterales bacterium]|nr:hypothetical protein [Solirubrobacterales bacterium]
MTTYTYDALNRLTEAKTQTSGGTTTADDLYTLDGVGNLTKSAASPAPPPRTHTTPATRSAGPTPAPAATPAARHPQARTATATTQTATRPQTATG